MKKLILFFIFLTVIIAEDNIKIELLDSIKLDEKTGTASSIILLKDEQSIEEGAVKQN